MRAVSPGQQVVEEPAPAPAPSSSPASAARAAAAPPLAEPREDRRVEAAAALARYPPLRPRAEQLRDLRPLQPQPRLEPEDTEDAEEEEEDVDVLNAPIARHYGQQQGDVLVLDVQYVNNKRNGKEVLSHKLSVPSVGADPGNACI